MPLVFLSSQRMIGLDQMVRFLCDFFICYDRHYELSHCKWYVLIQFSELKLRFFEYLIFALVQISGLFCSFQFFERSNSPLWKKSSQLQGIVQNECDVGPLSTTRFSIGKPLSTTRFSISNLTPKKPIIMELIPMCETLA